MISLQTNVTSLQAQQEMNVNNQFQSNTIRQLSSGYRINSSADDAAGLAVANQYNSDTAELQQGVRNANDGLSQLQIVDGGLGNISNMLNRMKTLATESATSTFTGNRTTLNNEYQDLVSEITRQASNIQLNSGGTLNNLLSVYIGGGRTSNQTGSTQVNIDLSGKANAVDAHSLGLSNTSVIGGGTSFGSNTVTNLADSNALFNLTGSAAGAETFAVDYVNASGNVAHQNVSISATTNGVTGAQFVTAINNALTGTGVTAQIGGGGDLQFGGTNLLQVTAGTSGGAPASQAVTSGATLLNGANYQSTGAFTALTGSTTPASATTETVNVLMGGTNYALQLSSVTSGTTAGDTVAHALASLNAQLKGTGLYATADAAGANITLQSSNVFSITSANPAVGGTGTGAVGTGSFFGTTAGNESVTGNPYTLSGAFTPLTPGVGGAQNGTVEALVVAIGGNNYNLTLDSSTSGTSAGDSIQHAVASLNTQLGNNTATAGIVASISANGQNIVLTSSTDFTLSAAVADGTGGAAAAGAGYVIGTGAGSGTVTPATYVASGAFVNFVGGGSGGTATTQQLTINGQTLRLSSAAGTALADNVGDAVTSLNGQLSSLGLSGITASAQGGNLVFTSAAAFTLSQGAVTDGTGGAAVAGAGSLFTTSTGTHAVTDESGLGTGPWDITGNFANFTNGSNSGQSTAETVIINNGTQGYTLSLNSTNAGSLGAALTYINTQLSGSGVLAGSNGSGQIVFSSSAAAFTVNEQSYLAGAGNAGSTGSGSATAGTPTATGPFTSQVNFQAFTPGNHSGTNTTEAMTLAVTGGSTYNLSLNSATTGTTAADNINDALASLNSQLNGSGVSATTDGSGHIIFTSPTAAFTLTENTNTPGTGQVGASGAGSWFAVGTTATPETVTGTGYASAVGAFTPFVSGAGTNGGATTEALSINGQTLTLSSVANGTIPAADSLANAVASLNDQLGLLGMTGFTASVSGQGIQFTANQSFTLSEATYGAGTGGTVVGAGGLFSTAGAQAVTAPSADTSATGNAQTAISAINAAVTALGLVQGQVGAGENTLNYAMSLAQSQITNFSAAESQIKDADIAAQAANLTKAQVLQQASIAAMAQANSSPQAVLKLLQ